MRRFVYAAAFCSLLAVMAPEAQAQALPINSDEAMQPAEGQFIYRTQIRYRRFRVDAADADIDVLIQSNVFVYGWSQRLSSVVAFPLFFRDREGPMGDDTDLGVGDIKAIARYQIWKKLAYLESGSLTILSGVEIPSYDDPFSSRSWDPILGTVYSWRKNRRGFGADLVYQFNTKNDRGIRAGDFLRYDLVAQYRLWPGEYRSETRRTLTGLLELNGEYRWQAEMDNHALSGTRGHQVFLSPGLVLAGKRTKWELGFQIPIHRDVGRSTAKDEIRFVLGFAFTF